MIGFDESYKLCCKHEICYFNNEIKEDIFFILCQVYNINQEKIQNFMSILLLHESSQYIYCGYFISAFLYLSQLHH